MQYYGVLVYVVKRRKYDHRRVIGDAVRKRRRGLSLSQEQLAEAVECHRNYVGNVERGEQNITIDVLCRFARALKCGVAELLEEC